MKAMQHPHTDFLNRNCKAVIRIAVDFIEGVS